MIINIATCKIIIKRIKEKLDCLSELIHVKAENSFIKKCVAQEFKKYTYTDTLTVQMYVLYILYRTGNTVHV